MTIHSITFVHPGWLVVGLAAAAMIVALGVRLDRRRRAALASFGSRRLGAASSLSRTRRGVKRALIAVGLLAACAAMARPQRGFRWEETRRRGIDLLFAVDTSKSMLAPDVRPNRLTRAKLAIADLVDKFEGDRVGLVAFAGDAFLQCPLTLDRDMFTQTLDAVDTTLIPRGGTDVGRAVEVADAALRNQPANQKILVLLTDGEDLESHALTAARAAASHGVRIFTVGVGTAAGELVPLGDGRDGRFVRDEAGAFVRSRLDDKTLQAMASASGGDYRRLGADGRGLEALYRDVLARLPRETLGSRMQKVPLERFQWPLALAIACLALEPLIRERRRRRLPAEPPMRKPKVSAQRRRAAHAAAAALAIAIASGVARPAHASPNDAEHDYRAGKFADAAREYQRALSRSPGDARLQYNAGAAAYKAGDVTAANRAFEQALHSDRVELQQTAYYDLGNTLYRAGQRTIEKQPEQTIEQWKRSIVSYDSALKLDGKDADAVFNRDLVKRKLAELEQRQKQKQQSENQKQNDKDQQNKQQQDKQAQNQKGKGQQQQRQSQNQKGNGQQQQQQQPGRQDKNQQAQNQPGQQQQQPQAQQQQAQQQPAQQQQLAAQEKQEEAGAPGKLSRNDARALLDALRGDERLLPMAPSDRTRAPAPDDVVKKDW